MTKEIYVEAVVIEKQRGGPCGGTGLVALDDNGQITYENWVCFENTIEVMRLDLLALIEGLEFASDGDVIYSSSEYCVKGFNEWLDNWKRRGWRKASKKPIANRELWHQVDKLRSEKFMEVEKVDAYSPIGAKDAASKLAYSAASREL
ncbi:MAG: RNase H family protein [Marinomonas sp.]|uniref:RNase H family protein n=1 Tax=unclassified Marinomonas TaxID=196814 RepID=UPI00311D58F2